MSLTSRLILLCPSMPSPFTPFLEETDSEKNLKNLNINGNMPNESFKMMQEKLNRLIKELRK